MLLQFGLTLAAVIFTGASAYLNYQHMKHFGMGVAALVFGAELLKLCLPVAAQQHVKNRSFMGVIACVIIWFLAVTFSAVNTLGNTLTSHAREKARLGVQQASVTRPEHVVKRDIAAVPLCAQLDDKRKEWKTNSKGLRYEADVTVKVDDTKCLEARKRTIEAFESEITAQQKREETGQEVAIDKYTVEDGYMTLADTFGINVKRQNISLYLTLWWTLLCEVGSAFIGLAFVRKD